MVGVRLDHISELNDLNKLNNDNLKDAIGICKNFYRLGMSDKAINAWNKLIQECVAIKGQLEKGDVAESKLGVMKRFSDNVRKKIEKRMMMKLAPENYTTGAQVSDYVKQLDKKRVKQLEDMLELLNSNDQNAQSMLVDLAKRNLSYTFLIQTPGFGMDENGVDDFRGRLARGEIVMKKSVQNDNKKISQKDLKTGALADKSDEELLERLHKLRNDPFHMGEVSDNSFEIQLIENILQARNERSISQVANQTRIDESQADNRISENNALSDARVNSTYNQSVNQNRMNNAQTDNRINENNALSDASVNLTYNQSNNQNRMNNAQTDNVINEGRADSINRINEGNNESRRRERIAEEETLNTISQLGRENQFNAVLSSMMRDNLLTANEQEQLIEMERWRGRMDQARRENDQANRDEAQNRRIEDIQNRDRIREAEFYERVNEIIRNEQLEEENHRLEQNRLDRDADDRNRAVDRDAEARMHERAMMQLEYLQTIQLGAEQKKYLETLKIQLNEVKEFGKKESLRLKIERIFMAMMEAFEYLSSGGLGPAITENLPQLAAPPTPTALLPEANVFELES